MAYDPNRSREGERRQGAGDERGAPAGRSQIELPEALNLTRDRVRWGPIWAGLFRALITLIILSLLGRAVGLTAVSAA